MCQSFFCLLQLLFFQQFIEEDMTLQQVRGVFVKNLADGTVQLRLGDRRGKWTKIRCRTLEDLWSIKVAAPATPTVSQGRVSTDTPPVLLRWRAKLLTHVREAIRKIEQNAEEWGYPLDEFPIRDELIEMQLRLRQDPALSPNEPHLVLRKAKAYLALAELSDSD